MSNDTSAPSRTAPSTDAADIPAVQVSDAPIPARSGVPREAYNYVDWHLGEVKDAILRTLGDNAKSSKSGTVSAESVADAVAHFSRTQPFSDENVKSVWAQAAANILNVPGILWISAILSIVFGILGSQYNQPTLSDLAKVFAGAIVGASGATATAATRRS
jgi:hypothetical protein